MIEIKNVTKKYGNNIALKDVSFTVNDGEIFAFIGHNGAGKTTLIKAIVGIHKFDEGDILINGKSIKLDPVSCKKEMAFVPDNPELYEQMKARCDRQIGPPGNHDTKTARRDQHPQRRRAACHSSCDLHRISLFLHTRHHQ